jgi:hypothetical protein
MKIEPFSKCENGSYFHIWYPVKTWVILISNENCQVGSHDILTENRIENHWQFWAGEWEPPNTGIELQTWNAFSLQTPQCYHPTRFVLYKENMNCNEICKEII